MSFIMGLDLGQAVDYTALAIVEQTPSDPSPDGRSQWRYCIRWLERFDRGTPYPRMLEALEARFNTRILAQSRLAVDYTGVGRPVVDLLMSARLRVEIHPILITAGMKATRDDSGVHRVPKKDLVGTLQVLIQTGRLTVSPHLRLATALLKELGGFRARVSLAGSETFGAWRESQHDDLVLAVSLACWLAEEFRTVPADFYTS